ncbi:hypothetical protein ACFCXP_19640 [Streptomyces niveus]|uniref:hypothetical protein n=1 Tax=Streptomyces niveus TaxID=193462 RepID=UPI0035E2C1B6
MGTLEAALWSPAPSVAVGAATGPPDAALESVRETPGGATSSPVNSRPVLASRCSKLGESVLEVAREALVQGKR